MDIKKIKDYIYNNNKTEYILSEIGCKNIVKHDTYYTCSNYNGDNKNAINQYYDSSYLNCINHTRDIRINKKPENSTSIIDLVCYNKNLNLFQGCKYLCDLLGLDYYQLENDDDIPESLKLIQMLYDMKSGDYIEENTKLQPISEKILTYYKSYVNPMFFNDNISYEIQKLFEIGYDDETNHITIPIRDELGNLVGVKGRIFDYNVTENKYIYLEKCARSKILFGLDKSIKYIKEKGFVFVGESEKFCMQLFSMGYYNCVATGGKKISKMQKNKLMSLGVDLIFCFDKDVIKEEIIDLADSFEKINIFMIEDKDNLLNKKESPSDSREKWEQLIENSIVKIK